MLSFFFSQVHCWNEVNGCSVVLPASNIIEHVRHGCQHHVTHCPTCTSAVLCRDVCSHLKSRCTKLVLHARSESQDGVDNEKTLLIEFEKKVEQRVRELDDKLAQLSLQCGSQNDKLVVEVRHNINNLKEALTEQFGRATAQTVHRLDRIEERIRELDAKHAQLTLKSGSLSEKLAELLQNAIHLKEAVTEEIGTAFDRNASTIKTLYAEHRESLKTALTTAPVSTEVSNHAKTHQWVLTGYAALKENALKDGWSFSMSDEVYLRGYLMSWGIQFTKDGDSVGLLMSIQLHEGKEDGFLEWPFTKEVKLTVIHPLTLQERLLRERGSASKVCTVFFSRPINGSNVRRIFPNSKIESSDIERHGYVKGDQLLLRFEVLV
ncbi:hypothetical protein HPB48_023625 [Haemaphysalis longicornis]|uniref:MATH domain-containing protein n=1 Tax=Haemaphysalis longicornis TaxID=44386 RepID=A0A9J6H6J3_HAELO|nr:hypothetical protein HPB48_023625 [Haemaphysalis longicornis]